MAYEPDVDADIALRDGRRIAYCGWGTVTGGRSSCVTGAWVASFGPDSKTTAEAGVRLITVDRPAMDDLTPSPADVAELAAALGIEEFDVAGHFLRRPVRVGLRRQVPWAGPAGGVDQLHAPYGEPSSEQADEDEELTRLARQDLGRAAREIAHSAAWLVEARERFLTCPAQT